MASPLYVARNGSYEEFCEVFDAENNDVTDMLLGGLINRDADARFRISSDMLDKGADPCAVEEGQNTLSLLLGGHDHLSEGDCELVKRLVDGGADVNFRNGQGALVLRLAVEIDAEDDEDRRPVYEALFGVDELDLELPSSKRNPVNTVGKWLRMCVDAASGKHDVLDEFLKTKDY